MIRAGVIVLVHALVQALLVLGDPVPGPDLGFVLRAVASAVVLVIALVLLVPGSRRRGVATAVGTVLLGAAAALVSEILTVLVITVGALVLTARRTGWGRFLGRGLVVLVLVVLCRVVALLAGLLLAGPVAAAVTWLVAGSVAALVVDRDLLVR